MCPVLSRSSLKQQLKAKHLKDDRGVPSKTKNRSAETQDPPSQDPGDRITKPCRHNKHQCTSNASICLAVWKDMRVKRKWNGSETYRVKRTQQQHLQATQSPLMCALAIIIHIPSHSIAEGQCQCTRFSLPIEALRGSATPGRGHLVSRVVRSVNLLETWDLSREGLNGATRWLTGQARGGPDRRFLWVSQDRCIPLGYIGSLTTGSPTGSLSTFRESGFNVQSGHSEDLVFGSKVRAVLHRDWGYWKGD